MLARAVAIALGAGILPSVSQAQLYWDTNGATAGAGGTSPSGLWDTSTSNWNDTIDGRGGASRWVDGSDAVFSAGTDATGAFTVTVTPANLSVGAIKFEEGAVTINGNSGASILVRVGMKIDAVAGTHAINADLVGPNGVTKQGAGTVVLGGSNSFGNLDVLAGKVSVSTDANLGSGTVRLYGGAVSVTSSFSTSRTVAVESAAALEVVGASTTFTLSSGLSGGAGGALTKSGLGTLVLGGAGSFTGTTTISAGTLTAAATSGSALGATTAITVNSGGTLLLGGNDQLNNSAGVTLAGGTFAKGNFAEGSASSAGVGALTLTASGSRLDFGTGSAGAVTFTGFAPGTFSLTIDNWTGAPNTLGTASTDRLIFNSDQTANLSAFSFTGYDAGAMQFDLGGGFYEVIAISAVPEPSTYVAAVLAVLPIVARFVRSRLRPTVLPA